MHYDLYVGQPLVSDDAGQFNVGRHGLCWVHAERLVHKLDAFTDEIDYGFDFARSAVDWSPGRPLAARVRMAVAADRGWQSTGVAVRLREIMQDREQLAAIVDWELVTLGDPLLDLGHVLSLWPDRNIPVSKWFADTLPSADEVIERYAQVTGRDMSEFAWYRVLACYRLGLILEGTHARACAGLAPKDVGDMLHATTVALLERALELIG